MHEKTKESLLQSYDRAPFKWNFSLMIGIGTALCVALAFYISAEVYEHSTADDAHPALSSQLQEIRSDQLKTQIIDMDKMICADPNNVYYRQELLDLITKWEKINTPRKFPYELLRCINGNP